MGSQVGIVLSSQCTCDYYEISENMSGILFGYLEIVLKYVSEALEGITEALEGLEWYLNRYWSI